MVASAGTIAGIAGVMGFSTLVTLKWLKTTSTLHLTMALLAFVLGVVSLWLAADDIDSYILSGTATLGLIIAIAFGSKMVNLHDLFKATQVTKTSVLFPNKIFLFIFCTLRTIAVHVSKSKYV